MTATHAHRRWPWVLALALALVLAALVALAWWFPARWAWHWVRADYPAVHVSEIAGTVWDGRMDGLVVAGQPLGTLHWTLGRTAVFGHVHGSVDLRGAGVRASGRFERNAQGGLVIHDARFEVPMARLRVLWPAGVQLQGRLQGSVADARLVGGWPTVLDAKVRWRDAALVTRGQRVALGEWLSHWQASGGTVITAQLRDAGDGPVRLRGTFTATPLGWRLAARLTPRSDDAALRRWLQSIGEPAADGGVRVERRGGLMAGTTW